MFENILANCLIKPGNEILDFYWLAYAIDIYTKFQKKSTVFNRIWNPLFLIAGPLNFMILHHHPFQSAWKMDLSQVVLKNMEWNYQNWMKYKTFF